MNPDQTLLDKTIAAERDVLSVLLLFGERIDSVTSTLRAEDFVRPAHRAVFQAMLGLRDRSEPVSLPNVSSSMNGELAAVGGVGWLAALAGESRNEAFLASDARLVRDFADLRRLQALLAEGAKECFSQRPACDDLAEFFDSMERRIFAIRRDLSSSKRGRTLDQAMEELMVELSTEAARGTSTGLSDLDTTLGGLRKGELLIVAARTSKGKSSMCIQLTLNAVKQGMRALFFSLEMSVESLTTNILSNLSRTDSTKLRQRRSHLQDTITQYPGLPLYMLDTRGDFSLSKLRSEARRYAQEHGLDLLVVDYLQLMHDKGHSDRYAEVSAISRGLKVLAEELQIPVIAAAQLNRLAEREEPALHHLRESGSIEQDADVVLLLNQEDDSKPLICRVAKNRPAACGRVALAWIKPEHRIEDYAGPEPHSESAPVSGTRAKKKPPPELGWPGRSAAAQSILVVLVGLFGGYCGHGLARDMVRETRVEIADADSHARMLTALAALDFQPLMAGVR